eukprot:COSAG05_NODE_14401_length_398_cov_0.521739_1_plen_54_part_10
MLAHALYLAALVAAATVAQEGASAAATPNDGAPPTVVTRATATPDGDLTGAANA